ncbi:MAG: hypothetical protein ACTSXO_05445 [Candidatus Heimdallarchaeota archaeon]
MSGKQNSSYIEKKQRFSERKMAKVIEQYLRKRGYTTVCELVLNNRYFDIKEITGKELTKVRIDVAAHKNGNITFIEIENGLWLTHPLLYRELAHRLFLAFPKGYTSPVDKEQLQFAAAFGIGIVAVQKTGELELLAEPTNHPIPEKRARVIINLINKRARQKKEGNQSSPVTSSFK